MRQPIFTLLICVTACGAPDQPSEKAEVPVEPAQLTFEGADYKDEAAKIAHGKRLAMVLDCTGCHGDNMQGGNVTKDDPSYGDVYASNVTLLLANYSDEDFDQLIRRGRPKDGRELWYMPVESFQFLSDADLAAIIAYLRTLKPAGNPQPPIRRGPGMEKDIQSGLLGNAQQQIRKYRDDPPVDLGEQYAWGRYLTQTACTACHNNSLQGWEGFTPNLDIAGVYSEAELNHLLTTGEGKVKKDLGEMSEIVREGLSQLTPRERQAIIAYVLARASRPQQPQ